MNSPKRTAPAVMIAACAALLALAPAAQGYEAKGEPWPTRTVTYYNAASGWGGALGQAVRTWNSAGAAVRIRRTSRERADVIIRLAPRHELRGCSGEAQVGYSRFVRQAPVWLSRGCDRAGAVLVATHELGHVLGLGHEDGRCAAMNSYGVGGVPFRCLRAATVALEKPLHADDLRGLSRLYPAPVAIQAPALNLPVCAPPGRLCSQRWPTPSRQPT